MHTLRNDFPFFTSNERITFLDSAASSQKPKCVIDKLIHFYTTQYSTVHRGIYDLSSAAVEEYEGSRKNVAHFINASSEKEIVFTKNATEAINLVARSYIEPLISKNEEIVISGFEHHSNIIPWQQICKTKNAKLRVIPITKQGDFDYEELERVVSSQVKIIAVTQMSNVTGLVLDIPRIVKAAKQHGIKILVDACQAIAHMKIDVQNLDCDFLVFSSHKLYGPTGVGVLYGKYKLLDNARPFITGGSMIQDVSFKESSFLRPPYKFEAGTPPIAEVIAFGEAMLYLKSISLDKAWLEEKQIMQYIKSQIQKIKNFSIVSNCKDTSIVSIIHEKAHHSDIGDIMNKYRIAVRTGHHCAQPLMNYLKVSGTVRISLGIYNNYEDADHLIQSLIKLNKFFL